jgi:DNA-directed RNA polymerase subunit RPC12/RpoP
MPWKCPACQTQINHDGDTPQLGRVYRCHVCHLKLMLDADRNKLTLVPLPIEKNRRAPDSKA